MNMYASCNVYLYMRMRINFYYLHLLYIYEYTRYVWNILFVYFIYSAQQYSKIHSFNLIYNLFMMSLRSMIKNHARE